MKILIKLITISVILSSCAVKNTHTLGDLMQKRAYVELDISDIPNGVYIVRYLGTKNHIPLKRVIKL